MSTRPSLRQGPGGAPGREPGRLDPVLVRASRPAARRRIRVVVSALLAALVVTASGCTSHPAAPGASDPAVQRAQAVVARALTTTGDYSGPLSGPPAQRPGLIVFVAADLTDGGIAGVAQGVEQAAGAIGWPLRILDGQGTVPGQTAALDLALTLRPAWHHPGRIRRRRAAGGTATGQGAGHSRGRLALRGSAGPRSERGPVHQRDDEPRRGRSPGRQLCHREFRRHGRRGHFHGLGVRHRNLQGRRDGVDNQGVPALLGAPGRRQTDRRRATQRPRHGHCALGDLRKALHLSPGRQRRIHHRGAGRFLRGRVQGDQPPFSVAAGDGDASEFERIRAGEYQEATVAEPLYLQGWQLIDEINRARAGQPPSGYVAPPHLVTHADVPSGAVFDPPSGYRENYLRIWRS